MPTILHRHSQEEWVLGASLIMLHYFILAEVENFRHRIPISLAVPLPSGAFITSGSLLVPNHSSLRWLVGTLRTLSARGQKFLQPGNLVCNRMELCGHIKSLRRERATNGTCHWLAPASIERSSAAARRPLISLISNRRPCEHPLRRFI